MAKQGGSNPESADHPEPAGQETPKPTSPLGDGIGGDGAGVDDTAEKELWTGRTNWRHFVGRLALWLFGNIVVGVIIGLIASGRADFTAWAATKLIVAIVLITAIFVFGSMALTILGTRYRVTSQRLFIERGILSQTVDQTELIRVDDVRIHKTLWDRIFGIGTVEVRTTDATDKETAITGVAEPETVAEAIRKNMRTLRKRSLFVENL